MSGAFFCYRWNNDGYIDYTSSLLPYLDWKLGNSYTVYQYIDEAGVSLKFVYLRNREFYDKIVRLID